MRNLGYRRNQVRRAKAKARAVARRWVDASYADDPRAIGKLASTHCRPCSCEMCGSERSYAGIVTIQEARAAVSAREQMQGVA